jgi:hypothetical protein
LEEYSRSVWPHVIPARITVQAAMTMATLMTLKQEELMHSL